MDSLSDFDLIKLFNSKPNEMNKYFTNKDELFFFVANFNDKGGYPYLEKNISKIDPHVQTLCIKDLLLKNNELAQQKLSLFNQYEVEFIKTLIDIDFNKFMKLYNHHPHEDYFIDAVDCNFNDLIKHMFEADNHLHLVILLFRYKKYDSIQKYSHLFIQKTNHVILTLCAITHEHELLDHLIDTLYTRFKTIEGLQALAGLNNDILFDYLINSERFSQADIATCVLTLSRDILIKNFDVIMRSKRLSHPIFETLIALIDKENNEEILLYEPDIRCQCGSKTFFKFVDENNDDVKVCERCTK
jgi:hypothetical protein